MNFDNIGRFKLFPVNVYYNNSYLNTIVPLSQGKTFTYIIFKMDTKKKEGMCVYVNDVTILNLKTKAYYIYIFQR